MKHVLFYQLPFVSTAAVDTITVGCRLQCAQHILCTKSCRSCHTLIIIIKCQRLDDFMWMYRQSRIRHFAFFPFMQIPCNSLQFLVHSTRAQKNFYCFSLCHFALVCLHKKKREIISSAFIHTERVFVRAFSCDASPYIQSHFFRSRI